MPARTTDSRRASPCSTWIPGGRVEGQRSTGGGRGTGSRAPADVVERARSAAFARTVTARLQTAGVTPPGPSLAPDTSTEPRMRARNLAQRMFVWPDPNLGQVADILGSMVTHLGPRMQWVAEPASDRFCRRSWDAYVVGSRPPVHLCPSFFRSGFEQQVRTLVHEAAHLARIGEVEGESYCVTFDCQAGCGSGFEAADSWSHYVHCLSNQTPDQATTITGGGPRVAPPPRPGPGAR